MAAVTLKLVVSRADSERRL
jgi:hypothetical protein